MMDLVLLVCLAASPATCREERVAISVEKIESRMCMAGAAPVIAEWTETNADWQVSRWTCVSPERAAALATGGRGN